MDFSVFNEWFAAIQKRIDETLVGDPQRIYDATLHISRAGGKRVRPLLCMLSCDAVGGKATDALDTAVAIELIHTFTLIHDDIMDRDDLRRGVPSVHKVYGEPTAILAGDLLFSKAFEMSDSRAARILARAASEICEGQEMDMSFEKRRDVSEKQYLEMIRRKTAVLLQAATESGAVIGGGNKKQVAALSAYGESVGMAFQIHDDVLDVVADEKKLGKPVGSDIAEGKMSLLAIKALEGLSGDDRKRLIGILDKEGNTQAEIDFARKLFKTSGAMDYCAKKAKAYVDAAKDALRDIPESASKKALLGFADYIIERKT